MAFCKNCGNQIDDKAVVCPACGVAQAPATTDEGGFGWSLLGCCVPIVGLILYLIWKDSKPKSAAAAGKGALVSVIIYVVVFVLYFILIALGAAMM